MPHAAVNSTSYVVRRSATFGRTDRDPITEFQPNVINELATQARLAASTKNPTNASGWRSPAPYSGLLSKLEQNFVDYNGYPSPFVDYGRNLFYPSVPSLGGINGSFPGVCSNDLARARNKALLSLKDQTVNLSIAFKERQKTVDLVTSALRNAVYIVKKAKSHLRTPWRRRGLLRSLKGKWKEAPEAWLLYRYGIIPTMLDAYGAVEALEKRENGTYDRYRVTVRGKSTTVLKPKTLTSSVGPFGRFYLIPNVRVDTLMLSGKYGARVRYDAALTQPSYLRLSEVGVTNPLEVAWELITFSFICDWFLSIGDWCSALDATLPFTYIGGSETVFIDWSGTTQFKDERVRITSSTGPAIHRQFSRQVPTSFPLASAFALKQNPINLTRLADALSLLASFAKS